MRFSRRHVMAATAGAAFAAMTATGFAADQTKYGLLAGKPYEGTKLNILSVVTPQFDGLMLRDKEFTDLTGIETEWTFIPFTNLQEKMVAEGIAANGAEAEVTISLGYPVTVNDPALTRRMVPSLERVAGSGVLTMPPATGAEDFSYFAQEAPGLFIGLGVGSDDLTLVHPNHSPYFYADERALPIGVRAMASLAVDFLAGNPISDDR